ncbi:biotin--[acetyl-CoA-carboxylase] ligase [Antricoccus suffuscus]|uniref:biotin--[acetyl-CoA-carboxylase] ligase n=1 Tax=Antricoccus suffuscus TaxID=1629062 RepID=UPI00192D1E07|nr:biotin--[acetyl-CoA-carboxylase] ligase [Antricoccus suffuscus]
MISSDMPQHAPQPLRSVALAQYAAWHPFWTNIDVVAETGSTNTDLLAIASEGAPEGTVLVTESQVAGRGRLDRAWTAPPSRGLAVSFLLRPGAIATAQWGWLPLVTGLGVYDALRGLGIDAALKWPNDVQAGTDRRKCCGILAQAAGATSGTAPAVVIGCGLNVLESADELPSTGTSVALELPGVAIDRTDVLVRLLDGFARRYSQWYADPGGFELASAYRAACGTIGLDVTVALPGRDTPMRGVARDVDAEGRLVVETSDGVQAVSAGDVVHVRPAAP